MFYLILSLFIGAICGSFVLCLESRRKKSQPSARSVCDQCGHVLAANDLIPIFSFLLLQGRCRYCTTQLPIALLFSELFGAALSVLYYLHFGFTSLYAYTVICSIPLALLALEDARSHHVSDGMQLLLALITLGGSFYFDGADISSRLFAVLVFGGMTFLLNRLFPHGLGEGDVIFVAITAYGSGIFYYPRLFLSGLCLALLAALINGLRHDNYRSIPIPLVTYLVFGLWLGWTIWPQSLIG